MSNSSRLRRSTATNDQPPHHFLSVLGFGSESTADPYEGVPGMELYTNKTREVIRPDEVAVVYEKVRTLTIQDYMPSPEFLEAESKRLHLHEILDEDGTHQHSAKSDLPSFFHHVLNNHSEDLNEVSDDQVLQSMARVLGESREYTERKLVENRTSIVKQILSSTVATACAMGVYETTAMALSAAGVVALPSVIALSTASSALYSLARSVGWSQIAINRVNQLIESDSRYLNFRTRKISIPTPRFLRPYLRTRSIREQALLEVSVAHLMDYMTVEGIRYLSSNDVYSYLISAIASGSTSLAVDRGAKLVRHLRQLCSAQGYQQICNAAASWGRRKPGTEFDAHPNPLLLSNLASLMDPIPIPIQPSVAIPGPASDLATRLVDTTVTGTTMAAALATVCIAEGPGGLATHLIQTEAIQDLVLHRLMDSKVFNRLRHRLIPLLSDKTLLEMKNTRANIWASIEHTMGIGGAYPEEYRALTKKFYALLLGQQLYSDEVLASLDVYQLKTVIERKGLREDMLVISTRQSTRASLIQFIKERQKEIFQVTYQELVYSLGKQTFQMAAALGTTKGLMLAFEAVNNNALSSLLGLEPRIVDDFNAEENREINYYSGPGDPLIPIANFLEKNPDIVHVLSESPITEIQPVTRETQSWEIAERKELYKAIRKERAERADLLKAENVQRYAEKVQAYGIKYGLTSTQMKNVQRMNELQALLDKQRTQIEIPTGENIRFQFGSVNPDKTPVARFKKEWEKMEFTDLYTQIRDTTRTHLINQQIAGPLSYVDLAIDSINYGKNTYNVGLAFSQLTDVYSDYTNWMGYAPTANIPTLREIGAAFVGGDGFEIPKRNVYQVMLEASLEQLRDGIVMDSRDLAWRIANKMLGGDTAYTDVDRLLFQNNFIGAMMGESTRSGWYGW